MSKSLFQHCGVRDMYSTRSNASPLKPMEFFASPLVPKMDQYRPEPRTLGFGTLPSPRKFIPGGAYQTTMPGVGTVSGTMAPQSVPVESYVADDSGALPGNAEYLMRQAQAQSESPVDFADFQPPAEVPEVPEFMKKRWIPYENPDQKRLIDLGYPLSGMRNPIIDSPDFPKQMEYALEDGWKLRDDTAIKSAELGMHYSAAPSSDLSQGRSTAPGRTPVPDNYDLFDELAKPMIKQLPMSVLAGQGEQPVSPAQGSPLYTRQRSLPTTPPPPGYDKEAWYEQGLMVPIEESNRLAEQMRQQRTAAMQGAPMGADNGSLVNLDDFQVPQRQAMPQQQDPMMQYQPQSPYQTGGQMPYPGGMSGPHMQGRMQNILDEMLSRQQYGRQFNDMQLQRDQYDDGWDRFQADIFNPLMGALGGSRTTAAMAADSNNRRSMIQNRRNFRRQLQDDQWGQTKDLISMIAANDPQTIKNQNALAKLQMEMYQKQINAQNANTQQFGAYSNAAYKSRTAAVQEQNARTNESNMLRMLNEGADRSQQGWARINQQAGQWEQSLAMRQAELEQRQANAAQHNDQFAIQQAFREQQELNDEAYRYQKLKDDMEARAEGLNSDGSSKVSDEFRKKYGVPRKEEPKQNQQGFDLMKMLGFNQAPTTSVSSTVPQTRQTSPLTTPRVNKTTGGSSGQRPVTSGKPLTDDVFKSLIAKYGRDIEGAKAEARRLGYRVN